MKRISLKKILLSERFWIIASSVLLFLFAYAPFVRSYFEAPRDRWYWGAEEYPLDLIGNLAIVRQGYAGNWLAHANYSSTMPDPSSILKIEYILIGHAARILHTDTTLMFFLVRFVISVIFLLVIYRIISSLFSSRLERVAAWLLILFAPSIMKPGDYTIGFYYFAVVDVLVTYRLLLAMPHYILGGLFGILSLFFLAKVLDRPSDRKSFGLAVAAGLVTSLVYAPTMVLILSTFPVYLLLTVILKKLHTQKWESVLSHISILFSYAMVVIVPIVYVRWVVAYGWQEYRASHMEKLNPFSTSFIEYILIIGGTYFMAIMGIPQIIRQQRALPLLLFSWIPIHPIGVFLLTPILGLNEIRFFLTPYFVVFGILAVYGIRFLTSLAAQKWRRHIAVIVIGLIFGVGVYAYEANYNRTHLCFCMQRYFTFAYPKRDLMGGMFWLRDHTKESDIVLSLYHAGSLVPAFSGNRVQVSWWFRLVEPPNFYPVMNQVFAFYRQAMTANEAHEFVKSNHIAYVFYGEEEQNPRWVPYPFLTEVYRNSGVIIYRVTL